MNTFNLKLDLDKTPSIPEWVTIRQGDRNGTTIEASIYDHGTLLTGSYGTRVAIRLPDGEHYYRKVGTFSSGVASVTIDETEAASVTGSTVGHFDIIDGSTVIASTADFGVRIMRSVTEGAEPGETYDDAIQEAIDDLNDAIDDLNDTIDAIPDTVEGILEDHPEWTTTVLDGSISTAKLTDRAVTNAKLADSAVRPNDTNFVTESQSKSVTTFADIDPDYVTYQGYTASQEGTFTANAIFNSYLMSCPDNGFEITSNAYRMFIVGAAPDEVAGTVTIISTLVNNGSGVTTVTVPRKGDLILYVENATWSMFVSTKASSPITIPRLSLVGIQDSFDRYSVKDNAVSDIGNGLLDIHSAVGLLNTTTGQVTSSQTTYTTYYFKVPVPTITVTCTNGFRALIAHADPTSGLTVNLVTLLYTYASGRVDTFTATYGQWVCISIANSSGSIELMTDIVKPFKLPSLELDYMQSDSFYCYRKSGSSRYLDVYYRSGNSLVRWELHNVPAVASNSDTWQLGRICGYDIVNGAFANEVELVSGGEFELAFKEHGASDYCGGNNHGDETTDTFLLHIDGSQVDLSSLDSAYHKFDRIDAIEIATINRCDTPSDDILRHQKAWTFENGTVKVRQNVEFLEDLVVDGALVCMFPANRSSFTHGVRVGSTTIEDLSSSGYVHVGTESNDIYYIMYGPHVTAKVTSKTDNVDDVSRMWINDTATLNKLYYTYWSGSNSTYPESVPSGTILQVESEYDVAYS